MVFAYPRTGEPGKISLVDDWDMIPGARGCTPQTCAFRDLHKVLIEAGAARVFGLSTQDTAYQREAAAAPAPAVPAAVGRQARADRALRLPTMQVAGLTLIKRLALVIDDGGITKVFYPVFPPDRNAGDVLAWLERAPAPMSERSRALADDGAARHLKRGRRMPDIALPTTAGRSVSFARLPGRTIVYCYPWTGRPGLPNPPGWDDIPGAHGSTPQTEGFRDLMPASGRSAPRCSGSPRSRPTTSANWSSASGCRSRSSATRASRCSGRWRCRPSRPAASPI